MALVTDAQLRVEQAILGIQDPYYLSTEILKLEDEGEPGKPGINRTPEELIPIYNWICKPRPPEYGPHVKWLRFWSSPRHTAKTYIALVYAFTKILANPNIRIIILAQEKSFAMESARLLKAWMEMPKVIDLYGEFKKPGEWSSDEEFTIIQRTKPLKDPTVRAMGLESPSQGKRCDLAIMDDMIGETNTSDEGIMKVERKISAMHPVIVKGGEALYTCTRWSPYDPSTDGDTVTGSPGLLKQWKTIGTWDAPPPRGYFGCYAQEGDQLIFPNAIPGEPLFPGVLPEASIAHYRQTMKPEEFNSQYLNEPIPDDSRYFSKENLQYFDYRLPDPNGEPGELMKNENLMGAITYMAIDPNSGKKFVKGKKRDDITFCVGGVKWQGTGAADDIPVGFIYEWCGGLWKPEKVQDTFFEFVRIYKPQRIFVETNIAGEHFLDPLRKQAKQKGIDFLPIEEIHSTLQGTGKKDSRIEAMQTPYSYQRILHERKLQNCKGETQMLNWKPGGAGHDDWIDVVAMWYLNATKRKHAPRAKTKGPIQLIGRGNTQYSYTGM